MEDGGWVGAEFRARVRRWEAAQGPEVVISVPVDIFMPMSFVCAADTLKPTVTKTARRTARNL